MWNVCDSIHSSCFFSHLIFNILKSTSAVGRYRSSRVLYQHFKVGLPKEHYIVCFCIEYWWLNINAQLTSFIFCFFLLDFTEKLLLAFSLWPYSTADQDFWVNVSWQSNVLMFASVISLLATLTKWHLLHSSWIMKLDLNHNDMEETQPTKEMWGSIVTWPIKHWSTLNIKDETSDLYFDSYCTY